MKAETSWICAVERTPLNFGMLVFPPFVIESTHFE